MPGRGWYGTLAVLIAGLPLPGAAQTPPMQVTPELSRLDAFSGVWERAAAGDSAQVSWARLEAKWEPGDTWMTWNVQLQFARGVRIYGRRSMTWDSERRLYVWAWLDTQSARINEGTAQWSDATTLVLEGEPFAWRDGRTYQFRTMYTFSSADRIRETHYRSVDGSPARKTEEAVLRRRAPAPQEDAEPATQDSPWQERLAFVARGSGVWITSNESYRTGENGEPVAYAMRFWMGMGGTTQHGCLWSADPARRPAVFWAFFTAWDPARGELLVQQSAPDGTIGIGYESPATGVAEQTFTAPDGTTWDVRHMRTELPPDTLVTSSFQRPQSGEWQPRRTYRWIRQPAGTPSPC